MKHLQLYRFWLGHRI